MPFGIGHLPTYTSNAVYMCVEGFNVLKSSNGIELSWFIQELLLFFWFWVSLALGGGAGGWGVSGWLTIVYMSSGMFRGKESWNRIELSQLVQDLLNFGVLGSLQLWEGGRWVGRVWGITGHGDVPTCIHMHVHACTCTHAHAHRHMYTCIEIANGHQHGGIHVYHVRHACACMHVCACACMCVWDTLHTPIPTPTPIHPARAWIQFDHMITI